MLFALALSNLEYNANYSYFWESKEVSWEFWRFHGSLSIEVS
jgi:hypothetical protein